MKWYVNEDEFFGERGPIQAESKSEIVLSMESNFVQWADETYEKYASMVGRKSTGNKEEFVSKIIEALRRSCEASLFESDATGKVIEERGDEDDPE